MVIQNQQNNCICDVEECGFNDWEENKQVSPKWLNSTSIREEEKKHVKTNLKNREECQLHWFLTWEIIKNSLE